MQIAYPCKCAEREKRSTLAPEAVIRQHLIDAHDHADPVNGERWKPADINKPSKWPVRDVLALADRLPLLRGGTVDDATHPDFGHVQVARNPDGSIRSVYTVREGEDGADVTGDFVQFWDRVEKPVAQDLKVTKRHGG